MRLKVKDNPLLGQQRTLTKFAWFPTVVIHICEAKKYILWLESYNEKQKFCFYDSIVSGHRVTKWVTIEKYIP